MQITLDLLNSADLFSARGRALFTNNFYTLIPLAKELFVKKNMDGLSVARLFLLTRKLGLERIFHLSSCLVEAETSCLEDGFNRQYCSYVTTAASTKY